LVIIRLFIYYVEYAKYLSFPEITTEQVSAVKESLEHMLTQLEELKSLVDTVKVNMSSTQSIIPSLVAQTKHLERTFSIIDALENHVSKVEVSVNQLDERISTIEQSTSISQKAFKVLTVWKKNRRNSSTKYPASCRNTKFKTILIPIENHQILVWNFVETCIK